MQPVTNRPCASLDSAERMLRDLDARKPFRQTTKAKSIHGLEGVEVLRHGLSNPVDALEANRSTLVHVSARR